MPGCDAVTASATMATCTSAPAPPTIAATCRRHGVPLILDNTCLSPILHRSFEWGANIVVHSTTKYISGHSDIIGGAVRQMSIADARAILAGQPDAATAYFRRVSGDSLRQKILPIVQGATAQAGVTQSYKQAIGQAAPLLQLQGSISEVKLDLVGPGGAPLPVVPR